MTADTDQYNDEDPVIIGSPERIDDLVLFGGCKVPH
jgi:hypothetical protein